MFDENPERSLLAYAALIGAFCRPEQSTVPFSMFRSMANEGILLNKHLVPTILKASSAMQMFRSGKTIHGFVIRKEYYSNIFVENALIDLYANCVDLRLSRSVFYSMKKGDMVS